MDGGISASFVSASTQLSINSSVVRPRRLVIGDITIDLETHEVTAPSLEAASEAGRVFVESIRGYLAPKAHGKSTADATDGSDDCPVCGQPHEDN